MDDASAPPVRDDLEHAAVKADDSPPQAVEVEPVGDADEPATIKEPGKLLRIGHMLGALRQELDDVDGSDSGRERMATIYDRSVEGLAEVLTGSLREELETFAITFGPGEEPTAAELRIAHAQLVGWLEGLLKGLQAALASQGQQQQLMALQQQLAGRANAGQGGAQEAPSTGQYL